MCIINLSICASYFIPLLHAYVKEHCHRCIMMSASLVQHHGNCIMSYSPFHSHGKFHHCIALAVQSYISRMHHSHGHWAHASRIILFNLINSLSKNVLEQKLTLISFLSRFTTRLRPWFYQNIDSCCKEWSLGAFSVEKQLISSHNGIVFPLAHNIIPCFLNFP